MQKQIDIMRLAHGKWQAILQSQGMDQNIMDGKHHPCPICGGKDRFRYIDKKGDGWWICNQCGSGDGMDMYMALTNQDFTQCVMDLKGRLGTFVCQPPKTISKDKRKANMKYNADLWKGGEKDHELLNEYMEYRGIKEAVWKGADLKLNPLVAYFDDDGNRVDNMPAMLARVSTRDGKLALIHRTYLYKSKSERIVHKKKMTSPSRDWRGGCVRLFATKGQTKLIVAEGIETALSVRQMVYEKSGELIPCWAAVNANAMEKMAVPDHITTVMIAADNDVSFTGQKVAYALANRLKVMENKKVRVVVPIEQGTDFNDEVKGNG